MELAGLAMAIIIGLSLGLIGGGGSILTVPVLVYIIGLNPVKAITYSLFIVGMTALVGAFDYYRKNLIDLRAAITFAIPSFVSVFATRHWLLPLIPHSLFEVGNFTFTREILIMVAFAFLMLFSAISMIRQKQQYKNLTRKSEESTFSYPFIFLEGIIVGVLTGFVGAGGGFLIIPALVLFARLPMKMAIGTSLLIIAINSLIGFSTDLIIGVTLDWRFLISFSCFAFAGILLGAFLSKKIEGSKLKPGFGWFTLAMAAFIIIKELLLRK
ncbi:MAG: sulfite exporter TauE/SafE family protein [Cytophagaceae bacterium]|nr:sulfite exporter TauE/SafE family protein [Cytophagaceae bacterium]